MLPVGFFFFFYMFLIKLRKFSLVQIWWEYFFLFLRKRQRIVLNMLSASIKIITWVFSFIWCAVKSIDWHFHWKTNLAFLELTQFLHSVLYVLYVVGFLLLLNFLQDFCICVHEWGWAGMFSFLLLLLCFGHQGEESFTKWVEDRSFLVILCKGLFKIKSSVLEYLIELPSQSIWFSCLLCEKIFNHWFNFLNGSRTVSSRVSYNVMFFPGILFIRWKTWNLLAYMVYS